MQTLFHELSTWLKDVSHVLSQWVIFCPFLTSASARSIEERRHDRDNFVMKFVISLAIQLTTGVISVAAGSYITLQIIGYRVEQLEYYKSSTEAWKQNMADRINHDESDIAVMKERHRIEELKDQVRTNGIASPHQN